MKANQTLCQGNNKYLFKVKVGYNTQLPLSIVFMKSQHSKMQGPWAPCSLDRGGYDSQKQSALAITTHAPHGPRAVVRVRLNVLCLSPVLFDKGECHREYSFLDYLSVWHELTWNNGLNSTNIYWAPMCQTIEVPNTQLPQHFCANIGHSSIILLLTACYKYQFQTYIVSSQYFPVSKISEILQSKDSENFQLWCNTFLPF